MKWKILFHREALKDHHSLPANLKERVNSALRRLVESVSEAKELGLDIKKLKGRWEGYYRLRIGNYRVIFKIVWEEHQIRIYRIIKRGAAYK